MKKYKYKIIRQPLELSEGKFNLLGSQGWELCGVINDNFGCVYYMKKEIE